MELINREIEKYAEAHSGPLDPLYDELERVTIEKTGMPNMLTGRAEGIFLRMLVRMSGSTRVVEIGTFTGYSALMMAEALPEDGKLFTMEIEDSHAQIARTYFDRAAQGKKVRLLMGRAEESLRNFSNGSVDFVFIDADKVSYPAYYREAKRIVRKHGLIVADNSLWYGRVLEPQDEDSRAVVRFNRIVAEDEEVEKVLLTVRDGVFLIRKK